jgi:putative ABC transport system permease protein
MALANLHRPGSAVVGMVLSLGLGLSVLVTIALVEGNLADQFGRRLPHTAPAYFFIDVQPDQVEPLTRTVAETDPGAILETAPMVRGRMISIKGVPVETARIAPDVAWAARGDRGLSTAAVPPPGTRVVDGHWWPSDYAGPPLVSVDRAVARGFGLSVGDRVGLNVLGHEINAEVASLRDIDWSSLSMNFAFLVSPGALTGAPYTVIATLRASDGRDLAIEKAVTDRLPNVSAIRVKEALQTARAVIDQADLAVRAAAAVTLAAGAMVLAGAVMAGHRRRVWDSVMLKVLGASRAQIRRVYLIEFGLIGLVTGLTAAGVAQGASWALLTRVMKTDWVFLPGQTLATLGGCIAAALIAGYVGTWRALRVQAAPVLREE